MFYICWKADLFLWSYCVLSRGAPPAPPPPRTPQRAPHPHVYIETYHADPYASTRRHMLSTQVSLLYTQGASGTLPPFPPIPICTLLKVVGHFPFQPPPSKKERDVQHIQVKGGGGGSKADTSLFPVSADHMRGSIKLKNE